MTLGQFVTLLGNATSYTLLVIGVYGLLTGRILAKREVEQYEKHKAAELAAKDAMIAELRRQLVEKDDEIDEWKGYTRQGLHLVGKTTDMAATAMERSTPTTG